MFGMHSSTVSRMFMHMIIVMYVGLKSLILWPDLLQKLPMNSKHCPNCVVIVDCFEICVERPTNVLARAQHTSHTNTITP